MSDEPVITPDSYVRTIARLKRIDLEDLKVPQRMLITYLKEVFEYTKKITNGQDRKWLYGELQPLCIGSVNGTEIGLIRAWPGSPAVAGTLEELITCGTRYVIDIESAGSLQEKLKGGDIALISEAIRDEGTSHQYFASDVKLIPSQKLTHLLADILSDDGAKPIIGPIWTTDGYYRETKRKVTAFRDSGVLAVDMSTAALFAVGKYRGIDVASARVITDFVLEEGWSFASGWDAVASSFRTLINASIKVLRLI